MNTEALAQQLCTPEFIEGRVLEYTDLHTGSLVGVMSFMALTTIAIAVLIYGIMHKDFDLVYIGGICSCFFGALLIAFTAGNIYQVERVAQLVEDPKTVVAEQFEKENERFADLFGVTLDELGSREAPERKPAA